MNSNFNKLISVKKTLLVWGIILIVFFLGLGFMVYDEEKNAEFLPFDKTLKEETYATLNVNLLDQEFAIETLDSEKRNYYLAYDESDYPHVVMLTSKALNTLKEIQDYTLSEESVEKPASVTIKGKTRKLDDEAYKLLEEYLNEGSEEADKISLEKIKQVIGDNYLDTSFDNEEEAITSLIIFGCFSLIGVILIVIYLVKVNNYKKTMKESGNIIDKFKEDYEKGKVLTYKENGIYLTNEYILTQNKGLKLFNLKDIVWIYRIKQKNTGITVSESLCIVTNDGKSNIITTSPAIGKKKKETFEELYQDIINKVPNALVGYTNENRQKAKEMYKK